MRGQPPRSRLDTKVSPSERLPGPPRCSSCDRKKDVGDGITCKKSKRLEVKKNTAEMLLVQSLVAGLHREIKRAGFSGYKIEYNKASNDPKMTKRRESTLLESLGVNSTRTKDEKMSKKSSW